MKTTTLPPAAGQAANTPTPFPFSVGFPLSIRPQLRSLAICGANHGEGWPILCEVPINTFHEADARSIVAACTAHVDRHLRGDSDQRKIAALVEALTTNGNAVLALVAAFPGKLPEDVRKLAAEAVVQSPAALALAKEGKS